MKIKVLCISLAVILGCIFLSACGEKYNGAELWNDPDITETAEMTALRETVEDIIEDNSIDRLVISELNHTASTAYETDDEQVILSLKDWLRSVKLSPSDFDGIDGMTSDALVFYTDNDQQTVLYLNFADDERVYLFVPVESGNADRFLINNYNETETAYEQIKGSMSED